MSRTALELFQPPGYLFIYALDKLRLRMSRTMLLTLRKPS